MPQLTRFAVIGTGSLGKEHARIYALLAAAGEAAFTAVFDTRLDHARRIADKFRVRACTTLEQCLEACDAVSLVTPTVTHFDLASRCLAAGKHVLVEKPMCDNAAQAAALVALARQHQRLLQVGHVERFNPVLKYLESAVHDPRFIEVHRLSPFPARSTDIGVVLDLMIHDLDIVLALVRSPLQTLDAVGIPVLSASEDIANARLRFANGCVANLTASRISPERMRKLRVFSAGPTASYVSLDYRAQEGFIYRLARANEPSSSIVAQWLGAKDRTVVSQFAGRRIVREPVPIEKDEPLLLELRSFVRCVRDQQTPLVSGESAKHALDLALQITRTIGSHNNRPTPTPPS
jgi:predicted dehydrogenase